MEIAALAPVGEIDLGNGRAVESGSEDGLHLRESIKPCGKFPAVFAFEKVEIELFPDIVREIGDFTVASSHRVVLKG